MIKPIQKAVKTEVLSGGSGKPVYTVSSNSKSTEIGLDTLIGDYAESGSHHGKKSYKKVQSIPGHPNVKVFCYYFDSRDGGEQAGWWFGDELGGANVWARCVSHGPTPPKVGWRVPWDAAKPEPGVLTVAPYQAGAAAAKPAVASGSSLPTTGKERLAAVKTEVKTEVKIDVKKNEKAIEQVEKSVKALVEKSKPLQKTDIAAVRSTLESFTPQNAKLMELSKSIIQELMAARKTSPADVEPLTKLQAKLRIVQTNMSGEFSRMRGIVSAADQEKKAEAVKEQQKKNETAHAKEFEDALPQLQVAVSAAEEAVEGVNAMASPLLEDPPEDSSEAFKTVMDDIEKAATEAQKKVGEARTMMNAKMQVAQKYAPEAKKKAVGEYSAMSSKLSDLQAQVLPYKTFKKDFKQRVEARKSLQEFVGKIGEAELEVEKASLVSASAAKALQMSKEELDSAQDLVTPAQTVVANVSKLLEGKLKMANAAMKHELLPLQSRIAESKKKLAEINEVLKRQRETWTLQTIYEKAAELVGNAEDAMSKCNDAELPFLKGIEVLPAAESEKALNNSVAACAEGVKIIQNAKSVLTQKLTEVKRFSKESTAAGISEINDYLDKIKAIEARLSAFRKETTDRKVMAVMAEGMDSVTSAEAKVSPMTSAAKILLEKDVAEQSVAKLKEAATKTTEAEKECNTALQEAGKLLRGKASKDKDLAQALEKLNARLRAAQQELDKVRKASAAAQKLIKVKEVAEEAEDKVLLIEATTERIVKLSKPEDEGLGVEEMTASAVLEVVELSADVTKKIQSCNSSVQPVQALLGQVPNAPAALKASLQKFVERTKKAQAEIDKVKISTKDQREKVLSENAVKDGAEKVVELEACLELIEEAEAPYLKGVEVLPPKETKKAMEEADRVSAEISKTLSAAKNFVATKSAEVRKYTAAGTKTCGEEMAKLSDRIAAASKTFANFTKDTNSRKRKATIQDAGEQVQELEAEVPKTADAMKPLLEKDSEGLSPEASATALKTLDELEKALQSKSNACRSLVATQVRECAGDAENKKLVEEMSKKLAAISLEVGKVLKGSQDYKQKLSAKAFLQESVDILKGLEDEIKTATEACAPLIEEKSERFLVAESLKTLGEALSSHMQEKDLTAEAMHKKMGKKLNQKAFVEFVAKAPEEMKKDELTFTEERRNAMFKSLDADGDGVAKLAEFKTILSTRFVCIQSVSITDDFEIGKSKTVGKLEVGQEVDGEGAKKKDGEMPRMKIKVVDGGAEGWVTTKGNSGTRYLEAVSPFKAFTKELDVKLGASAKAFSKAANIFGAKAASFRALPKDSPVQEKVAEAQAKLKSLSSSFESIKSKALQAKKEFPAMVVKEKNVVKDARERKEVDELIGSARPAVEALQAELTKLEEFAKPMKDVATEFATPLTALADVKALEEKILKDVPEVQKTLKELQAKEELVKPKDAAGTRAKKELAQWAAMLTSVSGVCAKVTNMVRACCGKIGTLKLASVTAAIEAELLEKGSSAEELFGKLAKKGERISEKSFAKYIEGLKDADCSGEHVKVVADKIEADGISRRTFLRLFQPYYRVTAKNAAITPECAIKDDEKPVRLAAGNEMLQLLERPKQTDESAPKRIKVKALSDGVTGWVAVKNVTKSEKPYLACVKDVPLEKDFGSKPDNSIRSVKECEILEVLEGPRQEIVAAPTRLRVKAATGQSGWITMKDHTGVVFAEVNTNSYIVTQTVAMTNKRAIQDCKVVKKIDTNQIFTVLEGPVDDGGVIRVKGSCKVDNEDVQGWITVKGNAGSAYAKPYEKQYTLKKDVELQQQLNSQSQKTATLAAGELVEALEGPKEETAAPLRRVKVRASTDNAEGWITSNQTVKAWSSVYKVLKACSLYTSKGSKDSAVRDIGMNEFSELQDGPSEVEGMMWVKVRMKKDNAVGWTPMKNDEGAHLIASSA